MTPPDDPIELIAGTHHALPAGRYTRTAFEPPITFAIGGADGGRWFAAQAADGFFDIQQGLLTADVIAVQFALATAFHGAGGAADSPADAVAALALLEANEGLTVLETSPAPMAGRTGSGATLDHAGNGDDFRAVLDVAAGPISIGPGRRLWLGLFDIEVGSGGGAGERAIVAVLVGGSVARWTEAIQAAAPILGTVTIGAGASVP